MVPRRTAERGRGRFWLMPRVVLTRSGSAPEYADSTLWWAARNFMLVCPSPIPALAYTTRMAESTPPREVDRRNWTCEMTFVPVAPRVSPFLPSVLLAPIQFRFDLISLPAFFPWATTLVRFGESPIHVLVVAIVRG